MAKVIGLTGGIGSGKTTIARYFMSLGVPVYIADDEAKKILYLPDVVKELTDFFGYGVLTDGQPDRKKLAAAVFSNPEMLKVLNGIIHPRVKRHFEQWVHSHKAEDIVIKETAILFESGSYKDCDAVILVTAPEEIRIARVIKRDGVTEGEVLERMANQWSEEKKRELSDYVIENIELRDAERQAQNILKELKIRKIRG